MSEELPIVDYLVLAESPYLEVNECNNCSARFFDRRNACASCGGTDFVRNRISNEAVLTSFSIVHRAAPSVPVPFVSAIVKTVDGTSVRANVVGLKDPMDAELGMNLILTTYSCGTDDEGKECIAFGYEPV